MKISFFFLRVFILISILATNFQFSPVYANSPAVEPDVVLLKSLSQQTYDYLTAQGFVLEKTGSDQYVTLVNADQERLLENRRIPYEILKSKNNPDRSMSLMSGSLSNSYLTVSILDSGQSTLSTSAGQYLLYPYASTSYLSVKVDNNVYTNRTIGSSSGLIISTALTFVDLNNAYILYRTPENIYVTLRYKLEGKALRYQLDFSNFSSLPHSVSARFLFDTQVDVNDGSPLYASNVGVRTYETNMPFPTYNSWRGYDFWPYSSLVSTGTFSSQPNRVVFAWWPGAVSNYWDYTANTSQAFYTPGYTSSPYSDSCVLLYFDQGMILPASTKTISTYYGVGEPTGITRREQLVSTFYRFKETVKASIQADALAFSAIQAKYVVALRPSYRDMISIVWTLIEPTPTKLAKLGKDAVVLGKFADAAGKIGIAATFMNGLSTLLIGIPTSASETDVRDKYLYPEIMNKTWIEPVTGGSYQGINGFLTGIDQEYQNYVNQIPNPLPDSYPLDSTISFLEGQISALNASMNSEVYVQSYANNMCTMAKLGVLQVQKTAMFDLADKMSIASDVSWVTTLTGIGAVVGGAGLKIAGVVGAPVTLGGSSVVLIPSEAALWSGVTTLLLVSDVIGGISGISGLTIQGALSSVSLEAFWQLANDLELRRALFRGTGDWIKTSSTGAPPLFAMPSAASAGDVQFVSMNVPNLQVGEDEATGEGTSTITLHNYGSSSATVAISGSITTEIDDAMPTVGLVGSSSVTLAAGEEKSIPFTYSLIRSSLVHYTGYDLHLFAAISYSSGAPEVIGPFVTHFYVGTSAQLSVLNSQIFTTLQRGSLPTDQVEFSNISFANNTTRATLLLSFAEGSDYDLHLYDSQNRHAGLNYDSGLVENNIPGVQYYASSTWPEFMILTNPGSEVYRVKIVAQNPNAGTTYDLSKLETPALPALMDATSGIKIDLIRTKAAQTMSKVISVQVFESGGTQGIHNLLVTPSTFSGPGASISSGQITCSSPGDVPVGGSIIALCSVTITPDKPAGTYTGALAATGTDDYGSPVSAVSYVTINLSNIELYENYIPLMLKK